MCEKSTAKTVSSFVCCEFSKGSPGRQKIDNGLYVQFGRICYFVEHASESDPVADTNCFAYVDWFENLQFDCATQMWYTEIISDDKRKHSFMKVNNLSNPLVTAEEKTDSHVLWFLNSGKKPFH